MIDPLLAASIIVLSKLLSLNALIPASKEPTPGKIIFLAFKHLEYYFFQDTQSKNKKIGPFSRDTKINEILQQLSAIMYL